MTEGAADGPSGPAGSSHSIVISNVYGDSNRGGALLTIAAARATARVAAGSKTTLMSNLRHFSEDMYPFTLAACPSVGLTGSPLLLEGSAGHNLASHLASLGALGLGVRVPRRAQGIGCGALHDADAVIAKGGQLFRNFPGRNLLGFWASAFPLLFAQRRSCPTAAYSVQIGPYWHKGSERAASLVLRRLDLVLARDEQSAEIAASLGATKVARMPDSAFGLRADDLIEPPPPGTPDGRILVITVHYVFAAEGAEQLRRSLRTVAQTLLDRDLIDWVVVTHQAGGRTKPDRHTASQLLSVLGNPERTILLDGFWSPGQLLGLYRRAEFVVSGRIHGSIMSLLAGTPSLAVDVVGTKAVDLFSSLGFDDYACANTVDGYGGLPSRVLDIIGQRARHRAKIEGQVERLRRETLAADALLREAIFPDRSAARHRAADL